MERIIQLKESEYNDLFEKASLNESSIEKLAQETYQEKGTFSIILRIDCGQDYHDQINLRTNSYIDDWGERYRLSIEDNRKIIDFVNSRSLEMMRKRFGNQIDNMNIWNKRLDHIRSWKIKFIGWAIFGWLAAAVLLIVSLIN